MSYDYLDNGKTESSTDSSEEFYPRKCVKCNHPESELKIDDTKDDGKWVNDKFEPELRKTLLEKFRHIINCHSIDTVADVSDNVLAESMVNGLEAYVIFAKYFAKPANARVYDDASMYQRCFCSQCDYIFNAEITDLDKGDPIKCLKGCGTVVGTVMSNTRL